MMAFKFADAALKEFNVALDEAMTALQFVSSSDYLRPRLGNVVAWNDLNAESRGMVQRFIQQKDVELGIVYRGFVILLAGNLEQIVRRLLQDAVSALNKEITNFDQLPESIRLHNTFRSGQTLATIAEPIDHFQVDYTKVAQNLATCIAGATSYSLNAEAFTIHVSNTTPKHVLDVFRRVGVSIEWTDLGQIKFLREVLEKKDTAETARAIESFLRDFIRLRNRIAHTGSGGASVNESDVARYVKVLRAFGQALAEVVTSKLEKGISQK
jgi:hypothetical protein